jgi:Malectin domain
MDRLLLPPRFRSLPQLKRRPFVPIRINCGGITPHIDALGRVWSSDAYFVGGSTFDSNADIADTSEDPLYNCERFGQASYDIPVPDGVYNVVLHFAEIL